MKHKRAIGVLAKAKDNLRVPDIQQITRDRSRYTLGNSQTVEGEQVLLVNGKEYIPPDVSLKMKVRQILVKLTATHGSRPQWQETKAHVLGRYCLSQEQKYQLESFHPRIQTVLHDDSSDDDDGKLVPIAPTGNQPAIAIVQGGANNAGSDSNGVSRRLTAFVLLSAEGAIALSQAIAQDKS